MTNDEINILITHEIIHCLCRDLGEPIYELTTRRTL